MCKNIHKNLDFYLLTCFNISVVNSHNGIGGAKMATTFGKELRKLRIDKDETIHAMAKKLEISISYLSAIEAGSRNIPNDMVDKIIEKYHLNKERSEILRQAEAESSKTLDIDLSAVSSEQRKLVFALSRKLNEMSDQDCLDILNKLK